MKNRFVLTKACGNYVLATILVMLLTEGYSFGQASKSSESGSTSQNTDEEKPETNALVRVMEELREMRQVIGRSVRCTSCTAMISKSRWSLSPQFAKRWKKKAESAARCISRGSSTLAISVSASCQVVFDPYELFMNL
jgi:hypothetical protein